MEIPVKVQRPIPPLPVDLKSNNDDDEEELEATTAISEPPSPRSAIAENAEDAFQNLFKTSASGSGEEELLRIASTYSRQITAKQIRLLLVLEWWAKKYEALSEKNYLTLNQKRKCLYNASHLRDFVTNWLSYKQYNNSDIFVMKALEHISLRKFLNENSLKVNIEK